MGKALKILVVEDSEDDMELLLRELRRGGYEPVHERVDTAEGLRAALAKDSWEILVCDHRMPKFSSFAALDLIRELQLDIPFIVVSGTVGESVAVETMRAGAHDYLMKDNLIRFVPVVERELREAASRRRRRLAEDQLHQSQKMEVIGQLTGGLAHDFNNLLSVVIGNLEFLAEELQGDKRLLTLVETAIKAAFTGAYLNRQLLAFSRKQSLSPKVVDLNKHVSAMLDMLRRTLGETIEIEAKYDRGPWTTEVDPTQLDSALLNLAVNARDAMPGGGKLTIEAMNLRLDDDYVSARPNLTPGEYVMLSVTDTGSGMPPEVLAQVFEPFFTTKDVGEGSGLGLSMVFGFAKQSGGHADIESVEGAGTTVKLYLPHARRSPEALQQKTGDIVKARNETILVVEDNPELLTLAMKVLRSLDYRVLEATNGKSALKVMEDATDIDLLLTDVMMPGGINGPALAEEAAVKYPGIKVLFMSGYAPNDMENQGSFSNDAPVLRKPFRKPELARMVRAVLDT